MEIESGLNSIIQSIFQEPVLNSIWKNGNEIALTGSYATGTEDTYSDIDIIIVSKYLSMVSSETVITSNRLLHLIYIPYYKIPDLVIEEICNSEYLYTSMITKSIILKTSPDNLLINLKQFVSKYFKETRNDMIESALINSISKNLTILERALNVLEINIISSLIIRDISRLLSGHYKMDYKGVVRYLNTNENIRFIKEAYISCPNNKSGFIGAVNSIISSFGGLSIEYTTGRSYSVNRNFINHVYISSYKDRNVINKIKSAISMIDKSLSLFFYIFFVGSNQFFEQGYHIIFFHKNPKLTISSKEWSEFSKIINFELSRKNLIVSSSYKSTFNNGFMFGGWDMTKKILPIFRNIWLIYDCKIKSIKDYSTSQQFFWGTYILNLFLMQCEKRVINSRQQLLEQLINLNRCDVSDIYGFSSILTCKATVAAFNQMFLENYYSIRENYDTFFLTLNSVNIDIRNSLDTVIESLFGILRFSKVDSVQFLNFYATIPNPILLLCNIISHIFSIVGLTPRDLFIAACFLKKHSYDTI